MDLSVPDWSSILINISSIVLCAVLITANDKRHLLGGIEIKIKLRDKGLIYSRDGLSCLGKYSFF